MLGRFVIIALLLLLDKWTRIAPTERPTTIPSAPTRIPTATPPPTTTILTKIPTAIPTVSGLIDSTHLYKYDDFK